MRLTPHPRIRVALVSASGISIAVSLISFALAFTVASPARTLRPLIPAVDSMYTPVYVSMAAAGLLLLAAVVAIVSSLHGNRAVDLAGCATFLSVLVLSMASLALAASIKTSTQSTIEVTLRTSLAAYGPGNVTIFNAWDDMQGDLKCCGVRTNLAQDNYMGTPWYRQVREGSPYSVPKIPNSCCAKQLTTSQLTDCTTNLVSLPAQNRYMNPVGCFEAVQQTTDAFTNRYIIISVLLFAASCTAGGLAVYHLLLASRLSPEGEKQLCSGGGGGGMQKQHLEVAYSNHGAALSLSRTSLASESTLHSSASRLHSKSPLTSSVYNGSGHRSQSRQLSPASSAVGARQDSASRLPTSSKYSVASSAGFTTAPPSPPLPKNSPNDPNKNLPTSRASSTLPAPAAIKAQPIRSSARTAKHQPANQRSGSMPPANPRALSPLANQRAVSPRASNKAKSTSAGSVSAVSTHSLSPPILREDTSSDASQKMPNASLTLPAHPVVLKAQPIRSSAGGGKQPPNQRSGSMPPVNLRAKSPSTNQKPKEALAEANHKKGSPTAANQRASMPLQREVSPTAVANRQGSTLPNSGGSAKQTTVLSANGKRESNF